MNTRARILQSVMDEIERHQLARQPITSSVLDQAIAAAMSVEAAQAPKRTRAKPDLVIIDDIILPSEDSITEEFKDNLGQIFRDFMINSRGGMVKDAAIIEQGVQKVIDLIMDMQPTEGTNLPRSPLPISSIEYKRRVNILSDHFTVTPDIYRAVLREVTEGQRRPTTSSKHPGLMMYVLNGRIGYWDSEDGFLKPDRKCCLPGFTLYHPKT